ncbi:MAG: hypothetical protein KGI98_13620 [Euryarchaeota archaeon]|nr:hypothetical protein [Euryarchaeota archaeon]
MDLGSDEKFLGAWFTGRPGLVDFGWMNPGAAGSQMENISGLFVLSDRRIRHYLGHDTPLGFTPSQQRSDFLLEIPLENITQVSIQKSLLELRPVLLLTLANGEQQVFYPPRKEILQELYDQVFAAAQASEATAPPGSGTAGQDPPLPSSDSDAPSFIHLHAEEEP